MIETSMVRAWVDDKATRDYIHSQTPWPDFGQAEDVGNAAVFLAGKAARFMTGTILNVDGGFTSR